MILLASILNIKDKQAEAMIKVKDIALEVATEFEKMTGRKYGLFETYKMEDADTALVIISSTAGTAKDAIDKLRAEGKKVGLLKIRLFRPFPKEEIAQALKHIKAIAVMDKCEGFSAAGGPLFAEVRSALFDLTEKPMAINYIYGLGGRDVRTTDIESVYSALDAIVESGQAGETYRYLGVRE